jgi:hypothetical protein
MKFEVELHMFCKGRIRVVDVPDIELKGEINHDLGRIFYYGQNDFQFDPDNNPSVSAGDIVRYHGTRYMLNPIGHKKVKTNGGALSSDPVKKIQQLYGGNKTT